MRAKLFGLVTLSLSGLAFTACGQGSSSADLGGAPTGAAGPTGNFDDQGSGGAAGQSPSKAQPADPAQAGNSSSSSTSSGSSGLPPPKPLDGCADPGSDLTRTMFMSVPTTNWFASATQARGVLLAHGAPDPALVRDADFLAYYAVRYSSTSPGGQGGVMNVVPEIGAAPSGSPYQVVVQVGAQAAPLAKGARPPTSLTFVVDTSISMTGRSMQLAVASMQAAVTKLAAGDVVNVVTTTSSASPLELTLETAADPKVLSTLGGIEADGGDDIPGALASAYDRALASYKTHGLNRVVFLSDGGAPTNLIDTKLIRAHAEPGAEGDIRLVGIGVGEPGGYLPALLERAAGAGKGALLFVDSKAEAAATLGARFDEVMNVAAAGVELRVDYPWFMTPDEPMTGGAIGADPTQIVPGELGPGGSVSFRQTMRLCNPAVLQLDPANVVVHLTWLTPDGVAVPPIDATVPVVAPQGTSSSAVNKVTAVLAYADALRSLQPSRIKAAHDRIAGPNMTPPTDPALVEIASLLTKHPLYKP